MILVTGATGHLGKATIEFLLAKGVAASEIAALVRDEAKAQDLKAKGITLKIGDYDNYESLVSAFKGVDKLLLVSGSDVANRAKQQENGVLAAKEAGVKHILYTSFERKNETGTSPVSFLADSHLQTEKIIKASGMNYTIFRNNLYFDALPMFFGENVAENGIFLPAGETKSSFALRKDMAEATANVLIGQGHENKEYSFSNSEKVSIGDIAKSLGEVLGKDISYTSPSSEVYVESLSKAGVPEQYIGVFNGFAEAIKQGEFDITNDDLEKILGRKPATVKSFLTETYASKN